VRRYVRGSDARSNCFAFRETTSISFGCYVPLTLRLYLDHDFSHELSGQLEAIGLNSLLEPRDSSRPSPPN
jgi:hypothetical protein